MVLALGLARGQAGPAWGGALDLGFCLWLAPVSVVTVGPGGLQGQGHLGILSGPHEVSAAETVCLASPCLAWVPAVRRVDVRPEELGGVPWPPAGAPPAWRAALCLRWGWAVRWPAASSELPWAWPQGLCLLVSTFTRVANLGTFQGSSALPQWVLPSFWAGRRELSGGLKITSSGKAATLWGGTEGRLPHLQPAASPSLCHVCRGLAEQTWAAQALG